MKAFLLREVERVNRNLLSISLSALIVLSASCYLAWDGFAALFGGPPELGPSTVEARLPGDLVTVRAERVIDTAYHDVGRRWVALVVGDRLLLTRTGPESTGVVFEGRLKPLPDGLREDVISSIEARYPDVEGRFLPLVLDATGYRGRLLVALAAWLGLAVLALWGSWRAATSLQDNYQDPSVQALERFGPRRAIVEAVERDLQGEREIVDYAMLGREWLVLPGVFQLQVARLEDVVWIHDGSPRWFQRRGLREVADHTLVVYDRHGIRLTFQSNRENVERLLFEVEKRTPWAVVGFSRNMQLLWKVDRRSFLEEVRERRRRLTTAAG